MATDHRGRPVHAGKRTYSIYKDGDRHMWSLDTSVVGEDNYKRVRYALYAGTDRHEDPDRTAGLITGHGDLGRNKWLEDAHLPAMGYPKDERTIGVIHTQGTVSIRGTVRTPERARIAAEAMNARINENRDLKTGRPKK